MADFLKYKYILIFSKRFWLAYSGLDKLKKVAKQKILNNRRYKKYDLNDKNQVFIILFFKSHQMFDLKI